MKHIIYLLWKNRIDSSKQLICTFPFKAVNQEGNAKLAAVY